MAHVAHSGTSGERLRSIGPRYLERVALCDGTSLLVRPLQGSDGPALQAALANLSPRSRRGRFLGPKAELSPDDLRSLLAADGEEHVALTAWAGEQLVAVGRFIRCGPGQAEVALAVIDVLHKKGIGAMLLTRLRLAALERGVTRFTGQVLLENDGMLRLLRKLGARMGLPSRGVYEAELALI